MKYIQRAIISIVLLFHLLPILAQPYRVQLAAYVEKVPFSYFSEAKIFGVYMLADQNNIYRYYLGDFKKKENAENAKRQAIKQGFKYASIIDVEKQRELCGKPCPYFTEESTYSDESTEFLNLSNIFFGFNKSVLSPIAKKELDKIVKILKSESRLKILVSGHTDVQGSADYNIALSKRRARNAKNYLINKGIKSKRIIAQVFGESQAENDLLTSKGETSSTLRSNQFDRRVVLAIFDPKSRQVTLGKKEKD